MYPPCPKCKQNSIFEIEDLGGGFTIAACIYCDLPQEEEHWGIYENHCWNCGFGIDSRYSIQSIIPGMGYYCGWCGKDLSEWKLRMGLITATELLQLNNQVIGGLNHVTVLRQMCGASQIPDYRCT